MVWIHVTASTCAGSVAAEIRSSSIASSVGRDARGDPGSRAPPRSPPSPIDITPMGRDPGAASPCAPGPRPSARSPRARREGVLGGDRAGEPSVMGGRPGPLRARAGEARRLSRKGAGRRCLETRRGRRASPADGWPLWPLARGGRRELDRRPRAASRRRGFPWALRARVAFAATLTNRLRSRVSPLGSRWRRGAR